MDVDNQVVVKGASLKCSSCKASRQMNDQYHRYLESLLDKETRCDGDRCRSRLRDHSMHHHTYFRPHSALTYYTVLYLYCIIQVYYSTFQSIVFLIPDQTTDLGVRTVCEARQTHLMQCSGNQTRNQQASHRLLRLTSASFSVDSDDNP